MKSARIVSSVIATSMLLACSGISSAEELRQFTRPQTKPVRASDLNVAIDSDVEILQSAHRILSGKPLNHLLFERYGVRSGHVSSQPPHLWTSATRQLP